MRRSSNATIAIASFFLAIILLTFAPILAVAGGQVGAGSPMGRGPFIEINEKIAGAPLIAPERVFTDATTDDDAPALCAAPDGKIAVVWISYDDKVDRLLCAQGQAGGAGAKAQWGANEEVTGAGEYMEPALAFDSQKTLWAVWAANLDGNYELFARCKNAQGWQAPVRLTNAEGGDFAPSLAVDAKGQIWVAWQGARDGNFEILIGRLSPSGLQDVRNVSSHPANDWAPSLAAAPSGRLCVAWDTCRNGSYDVYLREIRDAGMGEPVAIAATPAREANACAAVAPDGAVWVAYDVGDVDWGRGVKLHAKRSIELRRFKDGLVSKPAADFMASLAPALQAKTEQPKIAFDGAGLLQMAFMHFVTQGGAGMADTMDAESEAAAADPESAVAPAGAAAKKKGGGEAKGGGAQKGGKGGGQKGGQGGGAQKGAKAGAKKKAGGSHGIFYLYAASYEGAAWTKPRCLAQSSGRGNDRLRIVASGNGQVWAAWATDGRKFPYYEVRINGDVCAAPISATPASSQAKATLAAGPGEAPKIERAAEDPTAARERQPKIALGKEQYVLLFGDTHRHTDISRCNLGGDSTLADTYRYAMDVAGLDFISISDHDQDIAGWRFEEPSPKLKNYWWWQSEKMADLHTIPGKFIGMYGYERGRQTNAGGGHKNIVSAHRGVPITSETEPNEWFSTLKEKDVVIIPHQLADGPTAADWSKWNGAFERVAEIFQARGSYEYQQAPLSARIQREGYCLWDAFDKGVQIGIVASSDHGKTHGAYAGVFARGLTRDDIIEALYQKRTFGATTPVQLAATLDGVAMGQEVACAAAPSIKVAALGCEPISKIEIVKDKKFVFSREFGDKKAEFEFTDNASAPGTASYYYVRATIGDKDLAWSSPFWVKRK